MFHKKTENAMIKDETSRWRLLLCCGIFIWLVINLLQGLFTEIYEDEAYYFLYGEHLAWGYFDHPPMVGLMTFLGSHVFSGILGVRIIAILFSCLSLWILWKMVDERHPDREKVFLFFTLACAIVMFNVYGFVTTPDTALILFSALFLLVYRDYLLKPTWSKALLMGVLMACMVYSKYHAFLLLGLIVLSNLSLLKDGKFYVACLLAALLLVPHLLWQVEAGFPSLSYHLVQRSDDFKWVYFWEYLPNQLLVFNPLIFGAMVYVLLKYHAADRFERGLRFIIVGFFFFFWLMAFRGHVEPHWTIVGIIPVVFLLYRKCQVDNKLKTYVKRFVAPSLLLVVLMRVALATPMVERYGFYGKERYYKAIEEIAGDCPVAFKGSFQAPALYHYFTGKESSTLRSYYDRMTQFDIWQFERAWFGKRVFIDSFESPLMQSYDVDGVEVKGFFAEHFQTANRLISDFTITNADPLESTPVFHPGDTIRMDYSIFNPYDQAVDFHQEQLRMSLRILFLDMHKLFYCTYDDIVSIAPGETHNGSLYIVVGEEVKLGKNRLLLVVRDGIATFVTLKNAHEVMIQSIDEI